MKIGITGLAGSGKSSIFDILTDNTSSNSSTSGDGKSSKGGVGAVKVQDERLDVLSKMYDPRATVNAQFVATDLPKPPNEQIFAGQMLQNLQKMDALMLVVREFASDYVAHPLGAVDFKRDVESLLFDMNFQDIDILDKRIKRIQSETKSLSAGQRAPEEQKIALMQKMQADLEAGKAVRDQGLGAQELKQLSDTFLVTNLPLMLIVNIGEASLARKSAIEAEANALLGGSARAKAAAISAKLEMELLALSADERDEYRREMAVEGSALSSLIALSYSALGLISFFTVGSDEVRAWSVRDGSSAQQTAGAIHSDIERGFIRAEVVGYDDFIGAGSMQAAKKQGLVRNESRDYLTKDGDIINFLFSV